MGIGSTRTSFEGFRMVPDRLWLDHRLHAQDVRLWCALAFIARGRPYCDATDAALAEACNASERTIRDALGRLERAGYIIRNNRGPGRLIDLHPESDGSQSAELGLRVVG